LYIPSHFKEDRLAVLHEAIRRIGLGTLVTLGADGLVANHFPMLLDPQEGALGTLSGHMARANPQWRGMQTGTPPLAIFLGPHTYVSPSWYPTKQRTGEVVPTWNFLTVHAYGDLTFSHDPAELRDHVGKLTDLHEAGRPTPWAADDAPAEYLKDMLRGIIGFKFAITRLEGKWKMSQNRTAEDIAGVRAGLRREDGADHRAVLDIMDAADRPLKSD
jgi:transcriptional regulator